ncbi:MAG TPA: orotate phosphoribosyltransferase [Planctomycetota bacterium]|nr:orotate phosphoribosyltransferase [Planctomycetota bacterium]
MDKSEILAVLGDSRALLTGHFKLSSGLHARNYVQCALVQQYPVRLAKLCGALAEKWRDSGVTAVVGPAMGGIVLAYELARHLNARGLFMERGASGAFEFRRGFEVFDDDRVLVAEDVVTTGKSVREVLDRLVDTGAHVVGVTSLVCRNPDVDFGTEYRALIDLDIPAWDPETCPLCAEGVPLTKPGSRPDRKDGGTA